VSSSFGKALRAAREQRELSYQIERGETTPGHNDLGLLSRGLGVSLPVMVQWYVPASARSRRGHDKGSGRG
jgi:transcriptional regulator with XRE-family HTH domain